MSFSDDTLIAFVDGELDEAVRRSIEEGLRADDALAARIARLRLQRGERSERFGAQPPRPRRAGTVVQLASVRATRAAHAAAAKKAAQRSWGWQEWSALLLALLLGVLAGKVGLARWQPAWLGEPAPPSTVASRDGVLLAQGRLAWALSQQMGGAAPVENEVRVGLSFLSNEGTYCRTFTLAGASQDLTGIACRASDDWRIPVLVQGLRPLPQRGGFRSHGVEMPGALLEGIDQRIVGGMLDARAELEALRRGWQR
ncbi:MAG: anti-sigma factor [Sphingomonadaceae bacterium]